MNPINKQAAKVALVTGGARRIGAAIVKKLHSAGYNVAIHCRYTFAEAQQLADQLNEQRPDSTLVLQKELTEPHAGQDLMTAINTWAGQLHLLVNNASAFIRSDCHQVEDQNWNLLFNANVKAPFLLSLAARPLLAKNSGVIINITDIHAKKPLSGYSVYCQTKAALEMQTKSLAREFSPEIRVNAVAPGSIAWPENENSLNQDIQQKIIAETPLKRHGNPEFIAQAVLALAENPFITGQIVQVDGGRSLN